MTRHRPAARTVGFVLIAALAAGVAACTDDPTTPPTTLPAATTSTVAARRSDGVLDIGVLLPTTGPGATFGQPLADAIDAGLAEINEAGGVLGYPVEITVADEASGRGMEELVDSGVDAVIGPASSLVALSQLSVAVTAPNGIVVCSPSATALALDDFPDSGNFFRTAPSDSLQTRAITTRAQSTGQATIAIAYLDDPYGRGLAKSLRDDIVDDGNLAIVAEVPFSGDQTDLSTPATTALAPIPGVLVVLADADAGGLFLTAVDAAVGDDPIPNLIVNDAIRTASQRIASLRPEVRAKLVGIAPTSEFDDGPPGPFAAHALDCLNLIALATVLAGTDEPSQFRRSIASLTVVGNPCTSFAGCRDLIAQDLGIVYVGASGDLSLSGTTGDRTRATFDRFRFGDDGSELDPDGDPIAVP